MDFHWSVSEDYEGGNAADNDATVAGSRYVLGSVYDYGGAGRYQETTYDAVLGDYITVSSEIAGLERDIEYCNYSFRSSIPPARNPPASKGTGRITC
jgi:hypothetical protein